MNISIQNQGVSSRAWFSETIDVFETMQDEHVLGILTMRSMFPILQTQRDAWLSQFQLLRDAIRGKKGKVYLEFEVPRMGHRIDTVVLLDGIVLAIEFKIEAEHYQRSDIDQAYDYAIDLKYFHEGSHNLNVVPILVATNAKTVPITLEPHQREQGLYKTICTNAGGLRGAIDYIIQRLSSEEINDTEWERSRYCPTPTIIEAARALYAGHGVADISRNDAGAINLQKTSDVIVEIINKSKDKGHKSICFVTGVPGAGKTLVGLNIATKFSGEDTHSVFLSGNGPLVAILREALALDNIRRENEHGRKLRKTEARTQVKTFIQNVHHFLDECLRDPGAPVDHITLFDEAQRAWNKEQTSSFMRRKRGRSDICISESEFLISCMDRHGDWAVVICLVGGGQEINTGEAGIGAWIDAVVKSFPGWHLYISPSITDSEYGTGNVLREIEKHQAINFNYIKELHLGVSIRSFRAEKVSDFVKKVLDCELEQARTVLKELGSRYPILLTRNLDVAKKWLRTQASGSERYGIVVSSQAERLKPYAIDVKTPVDPVKWFLEGKDDVRSSYYLEDVATEFHIQGLELDWICVAWDGDFRYENKAWKHFSFQGSKWQKIKKEERQLYLKNAYRVLLTRARQGMIIYLPEGTKEDPTRDPAYYNSTYTYLRSIGIQEI